MIDLTLGQIADIVGGRLIGGALPDTRVTGSVEFDSRKITSGGLFLALPGARVDGHDFAEIAIEKGAVAILAAREVDVPAVLVPPVTKTDSNADIYAHDVHGHGAAVIEALSTLARAVVDEATSHGLRVVALTGSAGKTSTKDLIADVLATSGDTVAPPGSFNNEVGLPHTALRCTLDTDFLVAEMSARGIGHIAHLARITPPSIGAVLNVGSAHLGEFGSRENIARAKGELVEALPSAADGGIAVLNADDPFVAAMADRTQAKVVTFSAMVPPARGVDYWATDIELDDVARASFTLHTPNEEALPVRLKVFGAHQVSNALAAAAVGIEAGLSPERVVSALSSHAAASANRMDVRTRPDGVTVINDSYNANPDSMRAGIAALAYTASPRTEAASWAVLGQMAELGDDATLAHEAIGDQLVKYHIDNLITVGDNPNCAAMADRAARQGINTVSVRSVNEAVLELRSRLRGGDVVLVKASNSDGLWRVAEQLTTAQERT